MIRQNSQIGPLVYIDLRLVKIPAYGLELPTRAIAKQAGLAVYLCSINYFTETQLIKLANAVHLVIIFYLSFSTFFVEYRFPFMDNQRREHPSSMATSHDVTRVASRKLLNQGNCLINNNLSSAYGHRAFTAIWKSNINYSNIKIP